MVLGIPERVEPREFRSIIAQTGLTVRNEKRWPFFLSPAIYITRTLQRRHIKPDVNVDELRSDVRPIHPLVNRLFDVITRLENALIPWPVWGSSAFFVLHRADPSLMSIRLASGRSDREPEV